MFRWIRSSFRYCAILIRTWIQASQFYYWCCFCSNDFLIDLIKMEIKISWTILSCMHRRIRMVFPWKLRIKYCIWIEKIFERCRYITVDPETHSHQNVIWSWKLSFSRKSNIIQDMIKYITFRQFFKHIFIVEPLWNNIFVWSICWVRQISFFWRTRFRIYRIVS